MRKRVSNNRVVKKDGIGAHKKFSYTIINLTKEGKPMQFLDPINDFAFVRHEVAY